MSFEVGKYLSGPNRRWLSHEGSKGTVIMTFGDPNVLEITIDGRGCRAVLTGSYYGHTTCRLGARALRVGRVPDRQRALTVDGELGLHAPPSRGQEPRKSAGEQHQRGGLGDHGSSRKHPQSVQCVWEAPRSGERDRREG